MFAPNAIKWLVLLNIWFQCYNFKLYVQTVPRFRDWTGMWTNTHPAQDRPTLYCPGSSTIIMHLACKTACLNDVAEQPLKWCTAADTWQCRLRIFYNSPLPIIFSFNFTSLFVILWSLDHLRDCLIIWIICDFLSSLFPHH